LKAHRLLHHSTLVLRMIKNEKIEVGCVGQVKDARVARWERKTLDLLELSRTLGRRIHACVNNLKEIEDL